MTREEQIQNYAYNNCMTEDVDDNSYNLIVDAIKWANETMIEKVCEWLENECDIKDYLGGIFSDPCSIDFDWEKLSNNLRKVMEE